MEVFGLRYLPLYSLHSIPPHPFLSLPCFFPYPPSPFRFAFLPSWHLLFVCGLFAAKSRNETQAHVCRLSVVAWVGRQNSADKPVPLQQAAVGQVQRLTLSSQGKKGRGKPICYSHPCLSELEKYLFAQSAAVALTWNFKCLAERGKTSTTLLR